MKILTILLATFILLFASEGNKSVVKRVNEIKLSNKPIIFIFDSQTCPYCTKLEKELNSNEDLAPIAKKFNIYAIARDDQKIYKIFGKSVSTQELQMSYHVKATPNIVIFNKKAQRMFQTPGYISPKPLSKMLEFTLGVDSGEYNKSQWSEFLYKQKVTASKESKKASMQQH